MYLESYEAMAKVKTLEIGKRQNIKGFLFPVKQLELYFEGLRESLLDLFYLFHHDYKINLCFFLRKFKIKTKQMPLSKFKQGICMIIFAF